MKNQTERASRGAPETFGEFWVTIQNVPVNRRLVAQEAAKAGWDAALKTAEAAIERLQWQRQAEFKRAEKLQSGHVVLLEALRPFADLMDEAGLSHMEECHFGSGDFVIQAADIRRARAAIQQAERT